MAQLLAGTEDGVFLLVGEGNAWMARERFLEGQEVNGIAVPRNGKTTAYVATRRGGLFRLDLVSGKSEQLGVGTLPNGQRCIAISPHDPNVVYVGTEPVGIFKSTDGGATWRECKGVAELAARRNWLYPVPVVPPHIRHIHLDWSDRDTIYAAGQVGGVLKSTDGGYTWQDFTEGLDPDVHMITQDPKNPAVIYAVAGGGGGIIMANIQDYPPPLPQGRPVYRSTDGGKTWSCISVDFKRTYGVQMAVHPRDPARLITAVANKVPPMWAARPEKADAAVVYSHDSGKTWSEVVADGLPASFLVMVEAMTMGGDDGEQIFVATGGEGTKRLAAEKSGEIYTSRAFDKGWAKLPIKLPSIFCLSPL